MLTYILIDKEDRFFCRTTSSERFMSNNDITHMKTYEFRKVAENECNKLNLYAKYYNKDRRSSIPLLKVIPINLTFKKIEE